MINPPVANKYGYWTNDALPESPDEWLAGAQQHEGSWWIDWREWLNAYTGPQVAARVPGKGKLKVIEAAPGSYVKQRLDAAAE
jgi:polyhydroxyalkanoate synthase subunit PhaC